jgi:cytochrome b6-f complex iron-sulfur subunit
MTRRNFLKLGMGTLGALAALEAGGIAMLYLRSHGLDGAFGSIITAGRVEDFPEGSVTEFPDERFFLVRAAEGGFLAVHSRCPHLGCNVMWVPEKAEFLCPCHAAKFSLYGDHGKPPVSRALDTFAVTIKNGLVHVDTTELSQRDAFEPEQLVHA